MYTHTQPIKMELKQRTKLSMIALVGEIIGPDIYMHTHCFNSLFLCDLKAI